MNHPIGEIVTYRDIGLNNHQAQINGIVKPVVKDQDGNVRDRAGQWGYQATCLHFNKTILLIPFFHISDGSYSVQYDKVEGMEYNFWTDGENNRVDFWPKTVEIKGYSSC